MPLQEQTKCVIVVAEGLPLGPTVNIASVLATTLGHRMKSLIGPEVTDDTSEAFRGAGNKPCFLHQAFLCRVLFQFFGDLLILLSNLLRPL